MVLFTQICSCTWTFLVRFHDPPKTVSKKTHSDNRDLQKRNTVGQVERMWQNESPNHTGQAKVWQSNKAFMESNKLPTLHSDKGGNAPDFFGGRAVRRFTYWIENHPGWIIATSERARFGLYSLFGPTCVLMVRLARAWTPPAAAAAAPPQSRVP